MAQPSDLSRLSLSEATKLRAEVGGLLQRLITNRDQSERRLAEAGKRDPMKFITGQTSLENAIVSARDMLARLDALFAHLQPDLTESALTELVSASHHSAHRSAGRIGHKAAARAAVLTGSP